MYTSRNYELKHQISSKGASESWGWKLSMRDKKKPGAIYYRYQILVFEEIDEIEQTAPVWFLLFASLYFLSIFIFQNYL